MYGVVMTDCQRVKPATNTQVGLHFAEVCSAPMERVYVDFMGPITRSKQGNVAILAVIGGFSKYVVLHPVRALTAKMVVDFFCKNYFSSYGVLRSIVSDNARAFCSTQFKNVCFGWGIRHIAT
jgi:hypothetical protein